MIHATVGVISEGGPEGPLAGGIRGVRDAQTAPESDEILLRRFDESGSGDAFAEIVRRHAGWVYHVCRRGLRDAHLAEDATQAVFLLLSRKAAALKPETHLAGWLFRTCRYVLGDAKRNRARYKARVHRAKELAVRRFMDLSCGNDAGSDLSEAVDEAIATLREGDRQAVLMRFYEGLSIDEMAARLCITREGAKKRIVRALRRLRELLEGRVRLVGAGRVVLPMTVVVLLLRSRGIEAAPAGLLTVIAKAVTMPGWSSASAEAIARSVLQSAVHGTGKLLAAMALSVSSIFVVIAIQWAVRSRVDQPGAGALASRRVTDATMSSVAIPTASPKPARTRGFAAAPTPVRPSGSFGREQESTGGVSPADASAENEPYAGGDSGSSARSADAAHPSEGLRESIARPRLEQDPSPAVIERLRRASDPAAAHGIRRAAVADFIVPSPMAARRDGVLADPVRGRGVPLRIAGAGASTATVLPTSHVLPPSLRNPGTQRQPHVASYAAADWLKIPQLPEQQRHDLGARMPLSDVDGPESAVEDRGDWNESDALSLVLPGLGESEGMLVRRMGSPALGGEDFSVLPFPNRFPDATWDRMPEHPATGSSQTKDLRVVPEPSVLMSLLLLGGLVIAQRPRVHAATARKMGELAIKTAPAVRGRC